MVWRFPHQTFKCVVALGQMQTHFEELIQLIESLVHSTHYQFVRVVLASSEGRVRLIEVREGIEFRTELEEAFRQSFLALGLLGWERSEGIFEARSMIFSWYEGDNELCELFEKLCEEGVNRLGEEFERRSVN